MKDWPKYYGKMVLSPNISGDLGIVCGWTKKEAVEKMLSPKARERTAAIGQLYSREGINFIIRNAFLNPNLGHLVFVGLDLSGSMQFFRDFLEGKDPARDVLHKEIPEEKIEKFREWFSGHSYFISDGRVSEFAENLENAGPWTEYPESFPEPAHCEALNFPSEEAGFRIEGEKVAELWIRILDHILKFGRDKMSQYGEMQRELVGLTSVVCGEDSDNPFLPEYLTFSRKELEHYLKQIMTDRVPSDLEYTYGSRLRNHGGINQIESIISQIREEDYTRRAMAFTWNVADDNLNPKAPCLDLLQALVSGSRLHLTAYVRSNDMFGAWPQNALALRNIQKEIASATGKGMGKLVVVSNSAHIYEHDYAKAAETVKKYGKQLACRQDPRGSFVVGLKNGGIEAIHMTPHGRVLQKFCGKTATEVFHQIHSFVSEIPHALDLGAELQKAEIALEKNIEYRQDNPLAF